MANKQDDYYANTESSDKNKPANNLNPNLNINATNIDLFSLGSSGLKHSQGRVMEEFLLKLQGLKGVVFFTEMSSNSAIIGALRFLIRTLTNKCRFFVQAADETPVAHAEAEFIESCLEDMDHTWVDFLSECLSFLDYGWAVHEIVYKIRKGLHHEDLTINSRYDDGRFGWRRLPLRGQNTLDHWDIDYRDNSGNIRAYCGLDAYLGKSFILPVERMMHFRTETYKNNPEGRSLWRNSVVSYYILKRLEEVEAIGIERELTGIPVMQVPVQMLHSTASSSDKMLLGELQNMLAELKNDERGYAVIPSELDRDGKPTGYKFALLTSGGTRTLDVDQAKQYHKLNILQSALAQFIQLGVSGVGSHALASSSMGMFATALGSFLDNICATFTLQGIHRLMALNNVPSELWPSLQHDKITSPSLEEVGNYLMQLANSGILPPGGYPDLLNRLLEVADLPLPPEDLEHNHDVD